jgi:hypothetical protein
MTAAAEEEVLAAEAAKVTAATAVAIVEAVAWYGEQVVANREALGNGEEERKEGEAASTWAARWAEDVVDWRPEDEDAVTTPSLLSTTAGAVATREVVSNITGTCLNTEAGGEAKEEASAGTGYRGGLEAHGEAVGGCNFFINS